MPYAFEALKADLLARIRDLMPEWLPGGHWEGHEYKSSHVGGGNGRSLSVNAVTGLWKDFQSGEKGGDILDLYCRIHGVDTGEAYRRLGGKDISTAPRARAPDPEPVDEAKPPAEVHLEPSVFRHHKHGLPSRFWVYRTADGEPHHVVARYDHDRGKDVLPWFYNGSKWINRALKSPRPLYGLEKLARLTTRVLLCEGEKATDAAQAYFQTRPCLTWQGGTGQVKYADLEPLRGREVTLWPDADIPGEEAMATIAGRLLDLGCQVWRVNTKGRPQGWDAADAQESGMPKADLAKWLKEVSAPVVRIDEKPPAVTKLQTMPKGEVIEHDPASGSLVQLWQAHEFSLKGNGRPYVTLNNVAKCVELRGDTECYYDDFTLTVMMGMRPYDDNVNLEFTQWIQERRLIAEINPGTVYDGVRAYALAHRRNPLRDWLIGLQWDGTPRIRRLLAEGFGARDNLYHAEVGRCFMVGMVARVMRPGCQHDCMPVFEGEQGEGKTSALRVLGGDYYAEVHENIGTKDFYLDMVGKWIVEISEMDAFRRVQIQTIKGVISTPVDRFRAPYDRIASDHPRQGVFAGTTNADNWNTDDTGARRFWPVRCGRIDRKWLQTHREQLFAEAAHCFERGDDWWRVPEEAARRQREARQDLDVWHDLVMSHCEARDWVTVPGIIHEALEIKKQDATVAIQLRVAKILRQGGWVNRIRRTGDKIIRQWVRKAVRSDLT